MTDDPMHPPQEDIDLQRFKTVFLSTLVITPVAAAIVAVVIRAAFPEWEWAGAIAIGAMVGFWTSVLPGSIVGNYLHDRKTGEGAAHEAFGPTDQADQEDAEAAQPVVA